MSPSEHQKFTRYAPFVVMGMIALVGGTFFTVLTAQQNQDNRSQASITSGNFNRTLVGDNNIIGGDVRGDVIGDRNTIRGDVEGCVRGNYNRIGGRVRGTISGVGNVVAEGSRSGPCLSISTPTKAPTMAPTTVPTEAPAATPTVAIATPTPIEEPTATPVPATPTEAPTPTSEPTPTSQPTQPTSTPIPIATPEPGSTSLSFTLALHGLGKGGDSVNPNSQGNTTLIHPQRAVAVEVYNSSNALVKSLQGTVTFDSVSGHFKGLVGLGMEIVSGSYTVRVKADQFLRSAVPGIQTLTSGETFDLPLTVMVTGDINNDNQLNILDYNIMMGCYSDLTPAANCPAGDEVRADLTDDGAVNQFDYNLFLRELTNRGGQ